MRMTIKTPKPRNPFVAAALRRTAGSHRTVAGGLRQRQGRELQRELQHLKHSPP